MLRPGMLRLPARRVLRLLGLRRVLPSIVRGVQRRRAIPAPGRAMWWQAVAIGAVPGHALAKGARHRSGRRGPRVRMRGPPMLSAALCRVQRTGFSRHALA